MNLIYVNEIGEDYKGQKQYEFIFSESNELDMDEWYVIPASATSNSKSPHVEYISLVGLLKNSDIEFELVQNSDYFGVIDAIDGVVALAWEKFNYDLEFERLSFRFGEPLDVVVKKLKNRDLQLLKENIKQE
jgi:hypothetical protein